MNRAFLCAVPMVYWNCSNLPSESLEQQAMLMPECEYSIREGTPDGPRVRTSIIGASLVHRWDCRTNSESGWILQRSLPER